MASATGSSSCARRAVLTAAIMLLGSCVAPGDRYRPVTDSNVTVGDVAMTPLNDLNLGRDPIPPVLIEARAAPYADADLTSCAAIAGEVDRLDSVLGDDYDTTPPPDRRVTATSAVQQVITFLTPYRGLIREVSGANGRDWNLGQAISAGMMRRAYLKGLGESMGCDYPARPAPPKILHLPVIPPGEVTWNSATTAPAAPIIVSEPVI